jgi:hypothetical protein
MSISLKLCPLCKGPLAVRYPLHMSRDRTTRYVCQTHVPNSNKLSHYYIEVNGSVYTQIIHVPPYVILNLSNKETSDIYPFDLSVGQITQRDKVISLPRLPITTVEKLAERIKLLIVFS